MLREIEEVAQTEGEPKKRWFTSADIDLFVWCDGDRQICAFHLSYNKSLSEKVVTWSRAIGVRYVALDDGVRIGKHPASPVLIADAGLEIESVSPMLRDNAGELKPWILNFVLKCLKSESDRS